MKNAKDPKSWISCVISAPVHWPSLSAGRHLTWKCSIPVTFLTATAGVSIIQTRETRERAQYGLSLLINSERNLCSIWGNKTHLHESELCLFSLCSLTPGPTVSVYIILSLRNQLECDKIRCFLVLLFRSFDTLQEITLPGQGSGLCSKVHVLLMRTHYTQTHCGLATHFSLNFEVLPTFTKLGILFEIMLRNCYKFIAIGYDSVYTAFPVSLGVPSVVGISAWIMLLIPSRASLDWAWTHAAQRLAQSRHWLGETGKHQTRINAA